MQEAVLHFIKKHDLIEPKCTMVVGVSGGPDSLALLDWLNGNRHKLGIEKLICAHVDHMFRGNESLEDMQFVEDFCHKYSILFEGKRINVPEYQQKHQLSAQHAARECRYQFFEQVMDKHQARYVALAHHADDQMETMLMRQVRGSFIEGLAGIQPKRPFGGGFVIRPFLSVTRHEIEQYCMTRGLEPRRDPSNEKDTYARNRFRHTVIPFLKQENPKVHERYQYISEVLTEDNRLLMDLASKKIEEAILSKGDRELRLDIKQFRTMPLPLQRRGIHLILNYLYQSIPSSITSIHIEQLLTMLNHGHSSGSLDLPCGLMAIRAYDECFFHFGKQEEVEYHFELDIPGEIYLPNGWVITAERVATPFETESDNDTFSLSLNDEIKLPLIVRTRRDGDRMTLKGMNGSRKIKDIFIDRKVPRYKRKEWPVITDNTGRILWLPLLKKSAYASNQGGQNGYLLLRCVTD